MTQHIVKAFDAGVNQTRRGLNETGGLSGAEGKGVQ